MSVITRLRPSAAPSPVAPAAPGVRRPSSPPLTGVPATDPPPLRGLVPTQLTELALAHRFALAYTALALVFAAGLVLQINPFHVLPPLLRLPVMLLLVMLSLASLLSFSLALRVRAAQSGGIEVIEEAGRALALAPQTGRPLWAEPLSAYRGVRAVRLSSTRAMAPRRGHWAVRFEHDDPARSFLSGPHWTAGGATREAAQWARRFGLSIL